MTTTIFGIKNCDTMKKSFKWLEQNNVSYEFHDYKKHEPDTEVLKQAISAHGWERVINKRGTTWRRLPEDVQNTMNDDNAVKIALENPSLIKRPLLLHKGTTYLGFKEEKYKDIF